MRKRILALLLSASMMLSLAPMNGYAQGKDEPEKLTLQDVVDGEKEIKKDALSHAESAVGLKDNDLVTVIVDYEEEPVLERIDATQYVDYEEMEEKNQGEIASIQDQVDKVTDTIESVVKAKKKSHKPELLYTYSVTFTGCAMQVQYGDIAKIKEIEGVKEVYLTQRYEAPQTVTPKETTNMLTSRTMIGAEDLQKNPDYGYEGEGTVVAVLDTGVAYEHDAFSKTPEGQHLNKENVGALLKGEEKLQAVQDYEKKTKSADKELVATGENASASQITSGKDNGNVYKSDKIPFAYDYSNHDTNPTPTNENNHGTHVAGTVAADCDEMKGVAPDAQLVAMKVFRDDGYAYEEELIAALEDCAILSVDSVNMSLGSCCGFTKVPNDRLQAAYTNLGSVGVTLNISAGNSYTSAYHNNYKDYSLAENPDDGIVGTPSTQEAALSVASVENTHLAPSNVVTVGGEDYPYIDHGAEAELRLKLAAGEYDLVDVKLATEENVKDLDLTGKVAIAQRGEINFTTKVKNVADKGAVALLVYNNVEGTQAMSITNYLVPAVAISKEDGEKIIATLDNGVGKVSFDPEKKVGKLSPTANEMSDFSSWGTTPELRFKPEITAPGGNIYSAFYVEKRKERIWNDERNQHGISAYGRSSCNTATVC
jgi:lactocepin